MRSSGDSVSLCGGWEDLPQGRPQQIQGKGLLNKRCGALVQRLFLNLLWAVSTENDDREGRVQYPQLPQYAETVYSGHVEVQHDRIRSLLVT